MREFSELPVDVEPSRSRARRHLGRIIARETTRRRRRRFGARAVSAGLTLFLVLTVAPKGTNTDLQPLLGLADAVERMPRDLITETNVWYSKVDRMELVEVPPELTGGFELEFLLPSTEESWYGLGAVQRKRVTYGEPQFLSPEAARVFWTADLAAHYPTQRVVESEQSILEMHLLGEVADGPASDLRAVLERQVAGRGDRRPEEVELLRLSARLMQTHGADPAVRGTVLRVLADIPGIKVGTSPGMVEVWFDYLDGDRPLRLSYAFDADTAYLVRESLATLATQTEPSSFLEQANHWPAQPAGSFAGA